MVRNEQGHQGGRTRFCQETGSRCRAEIDEEYQQDLNGYDFKKIGVKAHALEHDVRHHTLIKIQYDGQPYIVEKSRFLVSPEPYDMGLIAFDEPMNFRSHMIECVRFFLPYPSCTSNEPLDAATDHHGADKKNQKNEGHNVKHGRAETQDETKLKIRVCTGHPAEGHQAGYHQESQGRHKIHDADGCGPGDRVPFAVEHVDLGYAAACLKRRRCSQEYIGKIGFKRCPESMYLRIMAEFANEYEYASGTR